MQFEYAPGATPIDPDEAQGLIRQNYLSALREADQGNIAPLMQFARE